MLRDETVALFLQGRETWNGWAEDMLADRRALEADGRWAAKRNSSGHLEPQNTATETWMRSAAAVFSFCVFVADAAGQTTGAGNGDKGSKPALPAGKAVPLDAGADFSGFIFPSDAWFDNAAFSGDASFNSAAFFGSARFDNAAFLGNTWFNGAIFSGYARFNGAAFTGNVWFDSAAFSGCARFDGVSFSANAFFGSAKFASSVGFGDARFLGYASFASAEFSGPVRFSEASFSGGAWFSYAAFNKRADFELARFTKKAVFDGLEAERAFSLAAAVFVHLPVFSQAEFKQPPELGGMSFPLPGFWKAGNADVIALYRDIRRMAAQGGDYEREHRAYKGELRSRRWTVDKWWSASVWLGLIYDAASDCGRSLSRPAGAWAVSILVFAALYWMQAAAGAKARCAEAGGVALQALYLSVKNALVIFAAARDVRAGQAYLCLYDGSAFQPHVPPAVAFAETLAQMPLSATLIFLFLLAVRNRFKLK